MKSKAYGRNVNMCTRAVLGLATRTSYCAPKAGMMAMTRTWALELGQYGITVNAVAPAWVRWHYDGISSERGIYRGRQ